MKKFKEYYFERNGKHAYPGKEGERIEYCFTRLADTMCEYIDMVAKDFMEKENE